MTNDFERRLLDHNNGKSTFTKQFVPWKVIYTEECSSSKEARKREKYFKSNAGRKRIEAIIK